MTTSKVYLHWAVRALFLVIGIGTPILTVYAFTQDPGAANIVFGSIAVGFASAISLIAACTYHRIEAAKDGLTLRYFPVYRKTISYAEISSFDLSEQPVSPLRYGGWGPQLAHGGLALTNRKGHILHLELITGHKYNVSLTDQAEGVRIQNILQERTGHLV